jgi:hypothetical protein
MNPVDPLPLRDIHLPPAVSWWPPGPGWWALLVMVIILLMAARLLWKKWQHKPLNKLALQEWQAIQADYAQHRDGTRLVQALSILLRRTCMSYVSRTRAASLTGDAWIQQLNELGNGMIFDEQLGRQLATAPYRRDLEIDADALLASSRRWLQSLPRRPAP